MLSLLFLIPLAYGQAGLQTDTRHFMYPGDRKLDSSNRHYWCPGCPLGRPCYSLNVAYGSSNALRSFTSENPYTCAEKCHQHVQCEAYTYRVLTRRCTLLSASGAQAYANGYVSGRPECLFPGASTLPSCAEPVLYYGHDLVVTQSNGFNECSRQCFGLPGCTHFSFTSTTRTCYLKSSKYFSAPSSDTFSAPRGCGSTTPTETSCLRSGVLYYGSALESFDTDNVEQCEAACRQRHGCLFFTFDQSHYGHLCVLLSSRAGERRAHGVISGSLNCDSPPTPRPVPWTRTTTANPGRPVMSNSSCFVEGVDYFGNDIRSVKTPGRFKCAQECAEEPRCQFFTFNTSTKMCYLKHSNANKRNAAKGVSGSVDCIFPLRRCLQDRLDFYGNDVGHIRAENAEVCAISCVAHSRCQHFTWTDGDCFMKDRRSQSRHGEGFVSGSTSCFNRPCFENIFLNSELLGEGREVQAGGPLQCFEACRAEHRCRGYNWKNGTCRLLRTLTGARGSRKGIAGLACTF